MMRILNHVALGSFKVAKETASWHTAPQDIGREKNALITRQPGRMVFLLDEIGPVVFKFVVCHVMRRLTVRQFRNRPISRLIGADPCVPCPMRREPRPPE